jgi:cell wall-associated NlpC family hydrolase
MLEQIVIALKEIVTAHRDTRVHYCRLEAVAFDGDGCVLVGAVLDEITLSGVMSDLGARFPGVDFDASRVQVLRSGVPRVMIAATNVTGLYAGSSFLAEMVSQLLNGWPLEVLMEEGRWAFVRLLDGYLGWAYRPYLAEVAAQAPTHIVCEPVSLLRAAPAADAPLVNRIVGGTAVVAECRGEWAHVALAGDSSTLLRPEMEGWVPEADLRALSAMPADEADRRRQVVADAARFTGVPYLWGGCTAFGIDCSGFSQLLHRLSGVILPCDADMQFDAGQPVEAPYRPGDLLFFGEAEAEARKITHVAVSLGGWHIIHSSRSRNGVHEDDVQAVEHLRESFVGARTFLGE